LQDVVTEFEKHDAFSFDVEAWGAYRNVPTQANLNWLSMATTGLCVAIPFGHPNGDVLVRKAYKKKNKLTGKFDSFPAVYDDPPEQMLPSDVFSIVKPLFFSDRLKIAHNATYDLISTAKYFGEVAPPEYSDTIVLQWLLDENMKQKGLKELIKRYFGLDYDQEHVGRCVEAHPFSKVGHYAYLDAKYTWLLWKKLNLQVEQEGLAKVRDFEMDVLGVLLNMGLTGAPVDEPAMHALIEEMRESLVDVEGRIYQAAGQRFNLNAAGQKAKVLYAPKREGGQGIKPFKLTDGGMKKKKAGQETLLSDYSTDAESLEHYPKNPVVKAMLEYSEIAKLMSYPEAYLGVEGDKDKPRRIFDGRIHPDFVQYGTVTGRFSCLAGSTVIETSRGLFTIAEYEPLEGDRVRTHENRWKPVTKKFYNGIADVSRVTLSNGYSLECTQDHKVWTPNGWIQAGELSPGSTVYVDITSVHSERSERSASAGHLPLRGEANNPRDCKTLWHNLPERLSDTPDVYGRRGVSAGEGSPLLPVTGGEPEPDARAVWLPAPQLQGGDTHSARLPATQGRGPLCAVTPGGDGRSTGLGLSPEPSGGTSHRRGQDKQLTGQLGVGDEVWARQAAWEEVTVREVAFVAPMGVWDLEVADDHSFIANGFIVHNCREPNLQNVPRPGTELGSKIRGLFVAPPGHKLIVADYGQIELVVLAHFAGPGKLYQGFLEGVDPHTMTAAGVLGKKPEDVLPQERQDYGKSLNFAVVFGAGNDKVASMANISVPEAKRLLEVHQRTFPEIYRFKEKVITACRSRRPPHVKTLLGRKRRLPSINSMNDGVRMSAERQAVNSVIQGSAADLIKLAMIRADNTLPVEMPLILTVHDELVTICPEDRAEEGVQIISEALLGEGIQKLLVTPLKADIKVVDKWSEAK
jgi:DNA polymerase I-like protein with 3'-5' exonuclease and polymerase domains